MSQTNNHMWWCRKLHLLGLTNHYQYSFSLNTWMNRGTWSGKVTGRRGWVPIRGRISLLFSAASKATMGPTSFRLNGQGGKWSWTLTSMQCRGSERVERYLNSPCTLLRHRDNGKRKAIHKLISRFRGQNKTRLSGTITLWNWILEVLDSNFGYDIGYPEVSRAFVQCRDIIYIKP
jgi:hypothetical protein